MQNHLTAIESDFGVTIYGKVIDAKTRKLGQYEVHSDFERWNGAIYNSYAEAEARMKYLVGVISKN